MALAKLGSDKHTDGALNDNDHGDLPTTPDLTCPQLDFEKVSSLADLSLHQIQKSYSFEIVSLFRWYILFGASVTPWRRPSSCLRLSCEPSPI